MAREGSRERQRGHEEDGECSIRDPGRRARGAAGSRPGIVQVGREGEPVERAPAALRRGATGSEGRGSHRTAAGGDGVRKRKGAGESAPSGGAPGRGRRLQRGGSSEEGRTAAGTHPRPGAETGGRLHAGKRPASEQPGLGIRSFQKNVPFFLLFFVLFKRTFRSF